MVTFKRFERSKNRKHKIFFKAKFSFSKCFFPKNGFGNEDEPFAKASLKQDL